MWRAQKYASAQQFTVFTSVNRRLQCLKRLFDTGYSCNLGLSEKGKVGTDAHITVLCITVNDEDIHHKDSRTLSVVTKVKEN
jgi:hypothetical protein